MAGDILNSRVSRKLSAVLSGHENWVNSAAFSPDGSRIVTSSQDKTARVWDAATGKAIAVLSGHESRVNSAAFSPDGSRIVTASADNTARVWDATTGKAIAVLSGHENRVWSAAFSPDGSRIVTASADNTARLWASSFRSTPLELAVQFIQHEVREQRRERPALRRSFFARLEQPVVEHAGRQEAPDEPKQAPVGDPRRHRGHDAATGMAIAVLSGHEGPVNSAAFSPDGSRIVTASRDKTARVWDAATGKAIAVLGGHERRVNSAAFSPDGSRIVTASLDETARVWDAATGKAIAVLGGHGKPVTSAAFSPDGSRIVTASHDKTARVWDVGAIPKGNILQAACALLRMHEDPVSLEGVTDYPLTFDRPTCVTDPPPPDFSAEPAAPESRR